MKILTIIGARPQFIRDKSISYWYIGSLLLKKRKQIYKHQGS